MLAQDEERRARAKSLIAEAGRLYDAGQPAQALERLQAAYAGYPSPAIHFNFGLTYRALGREPDAAESFDRFLAESPAADPSLTSRREEARGYLTELESRLAAIEVVADVVGARVTVDGQPAGTTPLPRPVRVRAGAHRVTVQTDQVREDSPVELRGGERVRLVLRLAATVRTAPAVLTAAPRAEATPPPIYRRWWLWTAVAVVAVAAATGTALAMREAPPFCDCKAGVLRF